MSLIEEFKEMQLGWDYAFYKNLIEPHIEDKESRHVRLNNNEASKQALAQRITTEGSSDFSIEGPVTVHNLKKSSADSSFSDALAGELQSEMRFKSELAAH